MLSFVYKMLIYVVKFSVFYYFCKNVQTMDVLFSFFAFPVNLVFALLWLASGILLWKRAPKSSVSRFLLSQTATVSSIILLLAAGLWIGFSGDRDFSSHPVFILILIYLQTVLLLVFLRGWRKPSGIIRWRFLFVHAGLLLAIGSAFWGAPDSEELRLKLSEGDTSTEAFRADGSTRWLNYELGLDSLKIDFDKDNVPVMISADIRVDDKVVNVGVNQPYAISLGEDVYIASFDRNDGGNSCVLQIVREPWKYFALAGIIMLLFGAFLLFVQGPQNERR